MPFSGFRDEAFAFYEGLEADNSKTYWVANKAVYDDLVRAPMLELADELAQEFAPAKVFRPNRDVRFSADKSPYKTHMGAFAPLSEGLGWYVQLDADGIRTGGGFYAHTKERTARYRAAVDDSRTGAELVTVMKALTKAGFEKRGDQVRTRPRGVPEDHPRLDLMRHESLSAGRQLPDGALATPAKLLTAVRKDWRTLRPLIDWLQANIDG
jgi:uncharacterized protein (TIGR02453 family)